MSVCSKEDIRKKEYEKNIESIDNLIRYKIYRYISVSCKKFNPDTSDGQIASFDKIKILTQILMLKKYWVII